MCGLTFELSGAEGVALERMVRRRLVAYNQGTKMSTHTVNLTKLEPLPDAVGLQKALEALEAAEVDLYPRDAQPTNVLRNRIQFSAFVLRSYLAKQERENDDAKDAERYRWLRSSETLDGPHIYGPDDDCILGGVDADEAVDAAIASVPAVG